MDRSDHHLTILSPISSTTEPDLIVVTSTFLYLSQFTVVPWSQLLPDPLPYTIATEGLKSDLTDPRLSSWEMILFLVILFWNKTYFII